jgi:hypothetical protein
METWQSTATGKSKEPGSLLGSQRIGDERDKGKQIDGNRSTSGEPFGSAGRKIGSGHEFRFDRLRNAFFHDPLHPGIDIHPAFLG